MAKLGTATEIETAKQILADAVEKGETYAESWQTLKDSLGGNPSFKPGYWETVFRTNTQSAYMAGKLQKYEGTGAVAYQLLVIEDERTSKICRHLLTESGYGAILPVGHRFWQKYGFPPYHFNCRTSVNPIYSSQVAKTGYIVEDIPMNRFTKFKPQKGFGGNPLDRGNWWDMTDSMKKQAVKFGLMDKILTKKKSLGLKVSEPDLTYKEKLIQIASKSIDRLNEKNVPKPIYGFKSMKPAEKRDAVCDWLIRKGIVSGKERFLITNTDGSVFAIQKGNKNGVQSLSVKEKLLTAKKNSLIFYHNHPLSGSFSYADAETLNTYPALKEMVAVGHNGTVYSLKIGKRIPKKEFRELRYTCTEPDLIKKLVKNYGWRYIVKER